MLYPCHREQEKFINPEPVERISKPSTPEPATIFTGKRKLFNVDDDEFSSDCDSDSISDSDTASADDSPFPQKSSVIAPTLLQDALNEATDDIDDGAEQSFNITNVLSVPATSFEEEKLRARSILSTLVQDTSIKTKSINISAASSVIVQRYNPKKPLNSLINKSDEFTLATKESSTQPTTHENPDKSSLPAKLDNLKEIFGRDVSFICIFTF
jgi:hypothetical protein